MIESDQNNLNNSQLLDDEIDLKEIFDVIWKGKILILLVTSFVAICSIVYSLMLPNYYTSESILVARDADSDGALSQYSGMASLVGINLPATNGTSIFKVMEIIKSREFVKHLITFENVLPSIIAAKSYDSSSQELYFDPEIYDVKTKTWTGKLPINQGIAPSYIEAHKEYGDMLSIIQDKITSHLHIKIQHFSPVFAKEFLALIIQEINKLEREREIDSSNQAQSYLRTELAQTSLVEMKESISKLIETELKKGMMASIHDDYSLISLEPPFIPEKKSGPIRSLIVILSTLIGGILSLTIVLVRHYASDKGIIDK